MKNPQTPPVGLREPRLTSCHKALAEVARMTAFQRDSLDAAKGLLAQLGLQDAEERVGGRTETFLSITVPGTMPKVEIYLYEDGAGFFVGTEWQAWETQDHDSLEELRNVFLEALGSAVRRALHKHPRQGGM